MVTAHDLIRKLNSRAVKASAAKITEISTNLTSRNSILLGIPSSGWYYSWYVVQTDDRNFGLHALHEDLFTQANELLERGSRENEQIILMSAYVAAMVTYTDSCRTMLHHYLPPFLHSTLTEMGIGADPNTKPYPFPLNPQEQEGKEILYSFALLEMTGT